MKNEKEILIPANNVTLHGILSVPTNAKAIVVFAHGSGSSRLSPRNSYVAHELQKAGLGTLLMDLLSEDEEEDRAMVFDIELLAERLILTKNWLAGQEQTRGLPVGYFGASTGAGAALWAAALDQENIFAVVSRGGRPDLAGAKLQWVQAPTLLLVGSKDSAVIELNKQAQVKMRCRAELKIIPGATHLFEESGALESVAQWAQKWFISCLPTSSKGEFPALPF